jgi:hypothetical protein
MQEPMDMGVLVGFADELGKGNISASVMQLYLQDALDCILSKNQDLVLLSFELVSVVLKQGLVHPLLVSFQCSGPSLTFSYLFVSNSASPLWLPWKRTHCWMFESRPFVSTSS